MKPTRLPQPSAVERLASFSRARMMALSTCAGLASAFFAAMVLASVDAGHKNADPAFDRVPTCRQFPGTTLLTVKIDTHRYGVMSEPYACVSRREPCRDEAAHAQSDVPELLNIAHAYTPEWATNAELVLRTPYESYLAHPTRDAVGFAVLTLIAVGLCVVISIY